MDKLKLIKQLRERVLAGGEVERAEALLLIEMEDRKDLLASLFESSAEVHRKFNKNGFSLCSIVSGKHGSCSEDCKFCAQSAHYEAGINPHGVMDYADILAAAKEVEKESVRRFSIVTSGKKLESAELEEVTYQYEKLSRETELNLCASHGTLGYNEMKRIKDSGVKMYHHNLETSKRYYSEICTTHLYEERVETILSAKRAGLKVCSGGIFGMGESRADRIDMLYDLKSLGVDSIPINILDPIPGTPLEKADGIDPTEVMKTIAVYRLVLPNTEIRYGAGRNKLGELQKLGFKVGVNGMITGNYLTTTGSDMARDRELIKFEKLRLF